MLIELIEMLLLFLDLFLESCELLLLLLMDVHAFLRSFPACKGIPALNAARTRSTSVAFTHSGSKSREGAGESAVGGCEGTDGLAEHF